MGVPLFSVGSRIGVLTCWTKADRDSTSTTGKLDSSKSELIMRTAQLVARTDYLKQISQFRDQHHRTTEACAAYIELARQLANGGPNVFDLLRQIAVMAEVRRVRLFYAKNPIALSELRRWRATSRGAEVFPDAEFRCVGSIEHQASPNGSIEQTGTRTLSESPTASEFSQSVHHEGIINSGSNPFIRYILRRSAWSASAMLLYPDLLDNAAAPRATRGSDESPYNDPAAELFGRDPTVGWYVAPITYCWSFTPAKSYSKWSDERRLVYGFIAIDNTGKDLRDHDSNELPRSRTWNELARLKLTWCAATLGFYLGKSDRSSVENLSRKT